MSDNNTNTDTKIVKDTNVRSERFKKLAKKRTVRLIKILDLLQNCSNKSNYYYTEEQINKIFTAIEEKLKQVKQSFNEKINKTDFDLEL